MTFDWREHDDDTVEYHFNPRLTIPDAMALLKGMPALAEAAWGRPSACRRRRRCLKPWASAALPAARGRERSQAEGS